MINRAHRIQVYRVHTGMGNSVYYVKILNVFVIVNWAVMDVIVNITWMKYVNLVLSDALFVLNIIKLFKLSVKFVILITFLLVVCVRKIKGVC